MDDSRWQRGGLTNAKQDPCLLDVLEAVCSSFSVCRNTNPQLFNLINQYPQEFIQILQQGIPAAGEGAGGGDAGAARPGGPGVIQVTPEEKEAIDRVRLPKCSDIEARGMGKGQLCTCALASTSQWAQCTQRSPSTTRCFFFSLRTAP